MGAAEDRDAKSNVAATTTDTPPGKEDVRLRRTDAGSSEKRAPIMRYLLHHVNSCIAVRE